METITAEALARDALAQFGLEHYSQVTFVKYRENHVYRAESATGEAVAIRLHRPGYRSDAEILSELRYVQRLAEAGLAVPQMMCAPDGNLLRVVSSGEHTRRASIQAWIPDARPSGDVERVFAAIDEPDESLFFAIGQLIGELHETGERLGVPPEFIRAPWDADALAGPTPLWGDPRALRSLSPEDAARISAAMTRLHGTLAAASTDASVYGVIHADATPENLMISEERMTLIDFDDFGTGWFAFDIVTPLFFYTTHPRYAEYEAALLHGYEQSRPLRADERELWETFLLARGLTYLGWASDRPGDPASIFIEQTVAPWVVRMAVAYVDDQPMPWTANRRTTRKEHR